MEKKKKKSKKKIGKPPVVVLFFAFVIMRVIYKLKYNVSIDRSGVKDIKGPTLVLCPHLSGKDHILTAMALYPTRPTYVLSEHFYANKLLRPVLKMMRTIPKKMFCPDAVSVLNIIRAAHEGNTVVLFPEGRLTWYGHSLRMTDGTAELVKTLKCDVYTVVSNGAGQTFPKWAKYTRKGKISIKTAKILSSDEIKSMDVDGIRALLSEKLKHDSETDMKDVEFKSKDLIKGLDGIVWRCPVCQKDDTLYYENGKIKCSCGMSVSLDGHSLLHGENGFPDGIKTPSEWYEYCESTVDITVPLERDVILSMTDENGYMVKNVGEGKMKITKDEFSYVGTAFGKDGSFTVSTSVMKAFPITVSGHIDAYNDGRLCNFETKNDKREVIKFVAYLDRVTMENDLKA